MRIAATRRLDIVLCDNSGWDLDRIAHRVRGDLQPEVEFHAFGASDYPTHRGKGVGEAAIIDEFIEKVLPARDVDFVAKCTGRLFVRNAPSLLAQANSGVDVLCALDRRLRFADSRFFILRKEIFARLHGLGAEIDESENVYLEHAFVKRLFREFADGARWEPFRMLPLYAGRSGTDGTRYDGPRELGEWAFRSAVRVAARTSRMQI
ncbi:MAG: hypothetical protein ABI717_00415 [Actinomycetota bacterium]